jgi:AcrR family transcriptional regulator
MENKQENIIGRVQEIFFRYGIKSVSMDDIAKELGISKKTLYQFFEDKNDLVKKVIDAKTDESFNCMERIARDLNAIEELLEVMRILNEQIGNYNPAVDYDLRKYYPDLYQNLFKSRRAKMLSMLVQNLEKGKTEGLYRLELNSLLIAKRYISRIENLHNTEDLISSQEIHSPEVFRELFIYHIRGISNAKGIAYLEKRLKEISNNTNDNNKTI